MKSLKTVLRELDPQQKIKVGSKSSSMFWYIGTADDLLKNIPLYNAYCDLYIDNLVKRAETRLKNAINAYPTPAEYARTELRTSTPNLTTEGYMKALELWFDNIRNLNEKKNQKEKWDEQYSNIQNREVIETALCDPIADYGVVRIIIKGHENGKYWTYDEAQKVPSCSFLNGGDEEE